MYYNIIIVTVIYSINADGLFNAVDLTLLKRAVLDEVQEGTGCHWYNGDLNADGDLTDTDVDLMLLYLLSGQS